ncbi:MAG TPA: flavin reductase family protein [Bryobacteraceae bacterium]|nr:flavin reductase family protein [Bryobacteraceae bacterium]
MIVDPAASSIQVLERLLVGVIVPRPIAFVSTISLDGVANLAPFSFFTAVCPKPPVVCFCNSVRTRDGSKKDTLRNVEATGEFVLNVVSEDFAQQMVTCSGEYPPDVSEFELSGLTPIASDLVKPPRVKESHVQMECRLLQVVTVSSEPGGGSLVMGEVLRFHVDDSVLVNDRVDPDRLRPVGRMGGLEYVRTTDRFSMTRPKV